MKNKIMFIVFFGMITVSALSFAEDQQVSIPKASPAELAQEQVTFNHNQGVYNDKANKVTRAKTSAAKKTKSNEQYLEKTQDQQDINKGQFIVKF